MNGILAELMHYTLKNQGASRCHKTFSIFLFHKRFFVVKEGSSDYKNVRKRRFFKEHLTEWFFTMNGSSMASLEEPFEAPLFVRVYNL